MKYANNAIGRDRKQFAFVTLHQSCNNANKQEITIVLNHKKVMNWSNMSIIDALKSKGYTAEKDPLFPPFGFYIINQFGVKYFVNGALDTVNYICDTDGSKTPYTKRDIINALYTPTKEEWCSYENGYSVATHEYLGIVKKQIGLIETRVRNNYEFTSTEIINTDFLDKGAEISVMIQVGKKYLVQIPVRNNDDLTVYIFVFTKKPTPLSVHAAYRLMELEHKFYTKQLSEVFICCECGREIHWLDIQGDFRDKLGQLEDRHCGCNVESRK